MNSVLNNHTLGVNFENLGSTFGPFFWSKKTYLAYDPQNKKKWSLVTLDPFQRFIRKAFGYYKNTHLKTIAPALHRPIANHSIHNIYALNLLMRLQKLWAKTYPKIAFPLDPIFTAGNTTLKDAKIICFAERHYDKADRWMIGRVINEMTQPGDIILLEGAPAGQKVEGSSQTQYIEKKCHYEGADIPNIDELASKIFVENLDDNEFMHLTKQIATPSSPIHLNEDSEILQMEKMINRYSELVVKIVNAYMTNPEENDLKEKYLKAIPIVLKNDFLQLKESRTLEAYSSLQENISTISATIVMPLIKINSYNNWKPEGDKVVQKSFFERNKSFVQQILKHVKEGKRVFLIAGAAHLLKLTPATPFREERGVEYLHNELKKYPWVVVAPKKYLYNPWFRFCNPLLTLNKEEQIGTYQKIN